jgi:hypothetical protein
MQAAKARAEFGTRIDCLLGKALRGLRNVGRI